MAMIVGWNGRNDTREIDQLINDLIESNNEQEERLRKLEPAQQSLKIEGFCHCDKPMTGLGSRNCLRSGDVLVMQA